MCCDQRTFWTSYVFIESLKLENVLAKERLKKKKTSNKIKKKSTEAATDRWTLRGFLKIDVPKF